jgi:hypothetical protein
MQNVPIQPMSSFDKSQTNEEDEQEDGGNDKEGDGDDEETNEGYSERQRSVRWRPRRVLKLIKAPALLHWSLSL